MADLPLVLLHAFPVDARMWDGVREPLAARTRLITPDQRGLGRSPLPDSDRVPTLDDAARDVIALLDKLELDKVVLGGCSMGGYVTMAVLRAVPERVGGIVLIDTKASSDAEEASDNRLVMAERVERDGVGWLPDAMLDALLGETTRAERPEVVAQVRELIKSQSPDGVAWAQRAMAMRPDSTETLRRADVPALVVVGEEDTLTRVDEAHAMVDALPKATLDIIPAAGHLAPVEQPAAVAEAILGWLR
ncbi:alpha/beta fold hydrolase [Haloechinothrix halophila]|uniref:alpha/beta fold hydrolase n=1 Tax=Haloechinothrix halophila TaxID=1069073 RepID=UPI000420AB19|nr:alpha/beta fold hydrolase [Haloechinothrix halophila]